MKINIDIKADFAGGITLSHLKEQIKDTVGSIEGVAIESASVSSAISVAGLDPVRLSVALYALDRIGGICPPSTLRILLWNASKDTLLQYVPAGHALWNKRIKSMIELGYIKHHQYGIPIIVNNNGDWSMSSGRPTSYIALQEKGRERLEELKEYIPDEIISGIDLCRPKTLQNILSQVINKPMGYIAAKDEDVAVKTKGKREPIK